MGKTGETFSHRNSKKKRIQTLHIICVLIGRLRTKNNSVSYTHLDVYKRQDAPSFNSTSLFSNVLTSEIQRILLTEGAYSSTLTGLRNT